jgi:hypothetical protein
VNPFDGISLVILRLNFEVRPGVNFEVHPELRAAWEQEKKKRETPVKEPLPVPAEVPVRAKPNAPAGITKQQALTAFAEMVTIDLKKALEDCPHWIIDARELRGTKGGRHSAVWNPVVLAICLYEQHRVSKSKLNQAFFAQAFLQDWREDWHENSSDLPDQP